MATKKMLFLILVHSCITQPNLNGCVCCVKTFQHSCHYSRHTAMQSTRCGLLLPMFGTTVSCAKMAELIKMPLGSRYTQGHGEGAHYFTTFLKGDFILS